MTCPKDLDDVNCAATDVCCPGQGCGAPGLCTGAFHCFSDDQCATGQKCCFVATRQTPPAGVQCTDSTLYWDTGNPVGAYCRSGTACSDEAGEFELCSFSGTHQPCAGSKTCTQLGLLLDGAPGGGQYVKTTGVCL